jgi:hypothetical protein
VAVTARAHLIYLRILLPESAVLQDACAVVICYDYDTTDHAFTGLSAREPGAEVVWGAGL